MHTRVRKPYGGESAGVSQPMSENKLSMPSADSFSYLLLVFVALSGEFPTSLVDLLPYSSDYKRKAITRLKKARWLYTYYSNHLRGLRLTAAGKRALIQFGPEPLASVLSGNGCVCLPKYDVPNRLRLHRMAEVLVTLYRSNVLVYPWEKPPVFFSQDQSKVMTISEACYYSSFEVKSIDERASFFGSSRATGLLLSPDLIYAIYNTADGEMKWEYASELRLKVFMEQDLCHQQLSYHYSQVTPAAIVFGRDMQQSITLLSGKRNNRKPFVLGNQFDHFYYLTLDHHGELLLPLLCSNERKAKFDQYLLSDFSPRRNYLMENDGFDDNGRPVLLAYTCDIPRIYSFFTGLEISDMTGVMICFDYQENVLREICGNRVSFIHIDSEEYERSVFHQPL